MIFIVGGHFANYNFFQTKILKSAKKKRGLPVLSSIKEMIFFPSYCNLAHIRKNHEQIFCIAHIRHLALV